MMIRIILLSLIIMPFHIIIAQSSFFKNYDQEYPGPAYSFTLTSDGGYALTGISSGLRLLKIDADGEALWQTSFNGLHGKAGLSIIETADGGFLAAGTQGKPDTSGHNYAAAYAVKTTEAGDSLWTFVWNEELESRAQIAAVLQPNDSTYTLAGTTEAQLNSDIPSEAILIALNTDGNERWMKKYDEYTHITSVTHTSDGGYFFGGLYGLIYFPFTEPYVAKTDEEGILLWEKRDGWNLSTGRVNSVIPAGDGEVLVCGTSIDGSNNRGVFVSKLDANGSLLWTQQYGGPEDDHATEIVATGQGNFTFAGYTSNNTTGEFDQYDIWLVNLNANGDVLWERSYGTEEAEIVTNLRKHPDGGFAISGYHVPSNDAFLVKTDSLGQVYFFTSVNSPNVLLTQELTSFPNPTTTTLFIELPEVDLSSAQSLWYTIIESSGKTVRKATISHHQLTPKALLSIEVVDLKSGIYFLKFSHHKRQYWTKFVKH